MPVSESGPAGQQALVGNDSAWTLVRIGLTVIQASLIIVFAAGLVGFIAVLAGLTPPFMLVLAVASGALLTALMGLCLCWNVPARWWVRNQARACTVLIMVAGMAGAAGLALSQVGGPVGIAMYWLFPVAFSASFLAFFCWVLFLKGLAEVFQREALVLSANVLLTVSFFFLLGCYFSRPGPFDVDLAGVPIIFEYLFMLGILFLWNLFLVIRIRGAVPMQTPRKR